MIWSWVLVMAFTVPIQTVSARPIGKNAPDNNIDNSNSNNNGTDWLSNVPDMFLYPAASPRKTNRQSSGMSTNASVPSGLKNNLNRKKRCRTTCPTVITARTLQSCISLCRQGRDLCCGNRLNGKDPFTGNKLLSCANGCEIAFYSRDVEHCYQQCNVGNGNCEYTPEWMKETGGEPFRMCRFCQDSKCPVDTKYPRSTHDCREGCNMASKLEVFYTAKTMEDRVSDDSDAAAADHCDGTTPDIPRFLFAGQSNIVGHSGQAKKDLFREIITIINEHRFKRYDGKGSKTEFRQKRRETTVDAIAKACNGALQSTEESSRYMAKRIYNLAGGLKKDSILSDKKILKGHPTNVCSFTDPTSSQATLGYLGCERPVTEWACGWENENFGPELLFSHYFPKIRGTRYFKKTIGVTKVAVGGTKIWQWVKPDHADKSYTNATSNTKGNTTTSRIDYSDLWFWNSLVKAIHADHGTIEAFVWFQGENDHFQKQTPFKEYLEKLTGLVADVRAEIFDAYQKKRARDRNRGVALGKSLFQRKEDIPVVIMELGPWIGNKVSVDQGNSPGNIITAQRTFVNEVDDNAVLINTGTNDDPNKRLSKFYHFDAASQIIMGADLATGLAKHLRARSKLKSKVDQSRFRNQTVPFIEL